MMPWCVWIMQDLTMLDTRHYDRDITDLYYNKLYIDSISGNEDRTMMGSAQEQCELISRCMFRCV